MRKQKEYYCERSLRNFVSKRSKMEVWIVTLNPFEENSKIMGVFSSREEALGHIPKILDENPDRDKWYQEDGEENEWRFCNADLLSVSSHVVGNLADY